MQRVTSASVTVDGVVRGAIGRGLLAYVGVGRDDAEPDAVYLADKIAGLRIFEDPAGKMGLDVAAIGGDVLVISQFTLYGDVRRGRRPSFDAAMEPVRAEALYLRVVALLRDRGLVVQTGVFRADMAVESVNDGPVTILVDGARGF